MQAGNLLIANNNNMPVSRDFIKYGTGLINKPRANGDVIGAFAETNSQAYLCHSFMTYCFAR